MGQLHAFRGSMLLAVAVLIAALAAPARAMSPAEALDDLPVLEWTEADEQLLAPIWRGNDDHGALFTPLYRGAFPGIEDYVYAPPDQDCSQQRATLRIDWDRTANTVHFLIKGKHFQVNPTVRRTEGVDFFHDPFHDAPGNITVGAYRLWTVLGSTTRQGDFY
jgi:hypothetical protein